ncbi:proton-conducting transporter membrane subunit [Candidatus Nesciobacter abundans]|uniref:NADH:quinone oxidoreductase/Mrp antiporter transmembrane domain-containing protein n=1 Tax=Candidatus Nesciobacter abundans TaxID=2601668 RepID=A0A5C0UG36_9PROT|nr:proton-conducting transporter membrane subunit [Candidatus Nesciobacter abundans]QEK39018.1 hypothetical protein FZC36_01030 [Candidatus Nesciobacter abundans]
MFRKNILENLMQKIKSISFRVLKNIALLFNKVVHIFLATKEILNFTMFFMYTLESFLKNIKFRKLCLFLGMVFVVLFENELSLILIWLMIFFSVLKYRSPIFIVIICVIICGLKNFHYTGLGFSYDTKSNLGYLARNYSESFSYIEYSLKTNYARVIFWSSSIITSLSLLLDVKIGKNPIHDIHYMGKNSDVGREESDIVDISSGILCSMFGIMKILSTNDILNTYVGYEIIFAGICLCLAKIQYKHLVSYMKYHLIASLFILLGVGYIYGQSGTMNIKDALSRNVDCSVFMLGLFFKSAILPTGSWVRFYSKIPSSLMFFMSAIITKVPLYSMSVFFSFNPSCFSPNFIVPYLFVFSMIYGAFLAYNSHKTKKILSFHITSQVSVIALLICLESYLFNGLICKDCCEIDSYFLDKNIVSPNVSFVNSYSSFFDHKISICESSLSFFDSILFKFIPKESFMLALRNNFFSLIYTMHHIWTKSTLFLFSEESLFNKNSTVQKDLISHKYSVNKLSTNEFVADFISKFSIFSLMGAPFTFGFLAKSLGMILVCLYGNIFFVLGFAITNLLTYISMEKYMFIKISTFNGSDNFNNVSETEGSLESDKCFDKNIQNCRNIQNSSTGNNDQNNSQKILISFISFMVHLSLILFVFFA